MIVILVVEDNTANMQLSTELLEEEGYGVLQATDGALGMSMANTELPDLILMDVSLPLVNGLDATMALKRDSRTRDIPIIALTAHAMAGDRERCLAAGCNDYDTKPVNASRLLGKINTLLMARSPEFVQRIQLLRSRQAPTLNAQAQRQIAAITEDLVRAKARLSATEAQLQKAHADRDSLSADLARAQSELSQANAQLSEAHADRDSMRLDLSRAQAALSQAKQEGDTLARTLASERAAHEAAKEEIARLTAEREATQEQAPLREAELPRAAPSAETRLAEEQMRARAERKSATERRLVEVQRDLDSCRSRLQIAEDRARMLEDQARALPPDAAILKLELDRTRQHAMRLQASLNNLQTALRNAVDSSFREMLQIQLGG